MNVFLENNYKQILKNSLLLLKKKQPKVYTFQNLAKSCKVQKTYLSKVLNGTAHLSSDQLFQALIFLNFGRGEKQYTFLLHEWVRSDLMDRKKELWRQIIHIQSLNLKTDKHLKARVLSDQLSETHLYYLDPYEQLVHFFLTVPRYAKNLGLIPKALGLSKDYFQSILVNLERGALIKKNSGGSGYRVVQQNLHLGTESNLLKPYRLLMRLPVLDQIQRRQSRQNYHFSVVFSANEKLRTQIQEEFFGFLKRMEEMVTRETHLEDVYQMCFDLFPWSQ